MLTKRLSRPGATVAGFLAGLTWLAACPRASGAENVLPAEQPLDLQAFVDSAVQSGAAKIVIPPGRYRVTPRDKQHLVLKNLHDIEIVADGVEMVCTETTRALTITDCRHVTLTGLTIDYDPLPFTQGRIAAMSPDKKVHDVDLFDGYPGSADVRASKYEIFRPDSRTLRCGDYAYTVLPTGPRSFRLTKTRSSAHDPEQVGDLVVINAEHAPGGAEPHAILIERGTNVKLERISLYASNCFGFFETDCDGTVYDHCRIDRRAPSDDPVRRADARLRSLDADAYHSKFARKGPTLIGCSARFQGDDGLNICGAYHMVTECSGRQLRVLANGNLFGVDEPLELFTYDGRRLPDAKAVSIEPAGKINDAEHAFLLKQHMTAGLRERWEPDAYTVTLDRDVDLPMGSLVCSTRRIGNGFLVKGCDFSFNRSRGVLIKASDGQVVDNTLTGNWGPAVLVSPEYWWLEAGSSNDVVIRGNTISDCHTTAIKVTAQGGLGEIAPAGAHNNIAVIDNTVRNCPEPSIRITSTDHLSILGNTIAKPQAITATSPHNALPDGISVQNCRNVSSDVHLAPGFDSPATADATPPTTRPAVVGEPR